MYQTFGDDSYRKEVFSCIPSLLMNMNVMAEHWITSQPSTHNDKQGQMPLCTFMLTYTLCITQAQIWGDLGSCELLVNTL